MSVLYKKLVTYLLIRLQSVRKGEHGKGCGMTLETKPQTDKGGKPKKTILGKCFSRNLKPGGIILAHKLEKPITDSSVISFILMNNNIKITITNRCLAESIDLLHCSKALTLQPHFPLIFLLL